MFYGLGPTKPFIYTKDNTNKDRYFIDESSIPIDLTGNYGDVNSILISNGTLTVLRPLTIPGTLVIL